ncbi:MULTISPECIES: hypothetical protein [Emticicia]|uniref:hypothetical protein n=1 Tax=Emticicia TaxID=312278 RepID=UPI00209E958C|nr:MULTISPECIES: hypothetical protein [Emticicia]UTA67909.1 hypothetical protein MB380_20275 [Emticicia sp. 21SJ11W-3]
MEKLLKFKSSSLSKSEMAKILGGGQCGYQQKVYHTMWDAYLKSYTTVVTTYWKPAPYDSNGVSKKNAVYLAGQNGTHYCCDHCPWNYPV